MGRRANPGTTIRLDYREHRQASKTPTALNPIRPALNRAGYVCGVCLGQTYHARVSTHTGAADTGADTAPSPSSSGPPLLDEADREPPLHGC